MAPEKSLVFQPKISKVNIRSWCILTLSRKTINHQHYCQFWAQVKCRNLHRNKVQYYKAFFIIAQKWSHTHPFSQHSHTHRPAHTHLSPYTDPNCFKLFCSFASQNYRDHAPSWPKGLLMLRFGYFHHWSTSVDLRINLSKGNQTALVHKVASLTLSSGFTIGPRDVHASETAWLNIAWSSTSDSSTSTKMWIGGFKIGVGEMRTK